MLAREGARLVVMNNAFSACRSRAQNSHDALGTAVDDGDRGAQMTYLVWFGVVGVPGRVLRLQGRASAGEGKGVDGRRRQNVDSRWQGK